MCSCQLVTPIKLADNIHVLNRLFNYPPVLKKAKMAY